MKPPALTFLVSTRNQHKLEEISAMLGPRVSLLTLRDFPNAPEIVEDAPDFTGNATKKAVTLANWLAATPSHSRITHVLADDSGLEVDALGGAPGVHSARFAALETGAPGNSSDAANNAKLLRLLARVPAEKRTARFRCVIALTPIPGRRPDSSSPVCHASEAEVATDIFQGACEGTILESPRGIAGFGYDPLFVPTGFTQTFAELSSEAKNQISHRSNALHRLKNRFLEQTTL